MIIDCLSIVSFVFVERRGGEEGVGIGSLFCRIDSHSDSVMSDDQVLIAKRSLLKYLGTSLTPLPSTL